VAGDNLFRDFQVDFSDEQLARLNPADLHHLPFVPRRPQAVNPEASHLARRRLLLALP
jgi:hypothetical protein